jgi:hypothetical protein
LRRPGEPADAEAGVRRGQPAALEAYFLRAEAPRLFNRQHRDALADLAAGRTAVFR